MIDLVNFILIFLSQTTSLRWLTFLLGYQTVIVTLLLFWIYLFLVMLTFHCIAYYYSHADWDGLCDHLRGVPWDDIFKLSASAGASEFCEWVQIGIDIYIPHPMYQVSLNHLHGFQLLAQLP